jgi:predicted nuclease with TOPRIM domain
MKQVEKLDKIRIGSKTLEEDLQHQALEEAERLRRIKEYQGKDAELEARINNLGVDRSKIDKAKVVENNAELKKKFEEENPGST